MNEETAILAAVPAWQQKHQHHSLLQREGESTEQLNAQKHPTHSQRKSGHTYLQVSQKQMIQIAPWCFLARWSG
jgi:GTP cyclohydrolase FolE2